MQVQLMTKDGWRAAGVFGLWGAASFGALSLQDLQYDFGHGICGPWGCGPPLQALLACHGFWLVSLATLLWVVHHRLPLHWERRIANLALLVAAAGLLGVAAHQAVFWWPYATEWSRPYVVQRYLFNVATLVDLPLVELALFGIAGRRLCGRRTANAIAEIVGRQPAPYLRLNPDQQADGCVDCHELATSGAAHR